MHEIKYYDNDVEEIVDYETASDRIYDDITWDDLEQIFIDGMRSGKFCISEFWHKLPDWMQININNEAFDDAFSYRFEEIEEDEKNA